MKKLFLPLLTILCLSSIPSYAASPIEDDTEIIEINQLTEEEIQYIESIPSVNDEIAQANPNTYVDLGMF